MPSTTKSVPDEVPLLQIGTEDGEPFLLDANVVVTGRTCIIGASGSGKSYAVGVICEELCKRGVPFAIVDSEGEYAGLKEKYDVVWVADDEKADLKWGSFSKKELAAQAPDVPPLILDVSEASDRSQKIGTFLGELYRAVEERRVPYLTIVEEADKFIPQVGDRLPILDEIARRGRKRGLGLMICTQRPSVVDKNILSQCGNQLVGKLVIKNDLEAVSQFFPERSLPKQLTGLASGNFYAMGGFSASPRCVRIRQRETRPGGVTPQFVRREVKPLKLSSWNAPLDDVPDEVVAEPKGREDLAEDDTPREDPKSPDKAPGGDRALGVAFAVPPEKVPGRLKRAKSYGLFGQQEVVAKIEPVQRRLLELRVGLKTGVLNRRYETKYSVIDAATGESVELSRKMVLSEGLERLLGLEAREVEVLRGLSEDEYRGAIDVADKAQVSASLARRVLQELERRKLAKSSTMGRVRVFKRTTSMPALSLMESPLELAEVEVSDEGAQKRGLDESRIREVVKGLRSDYDLVGVRSFLYPLYRIELVLRNKHRTVWIDGATGEEVDV